MSKFNFVISAKQKNAIGISCCFQKTVEAEDFDGALLKLYDYFDHVRVIACKRDGEFLNIQNNQEAANA